MEMNQNVYMSFQMLPLKSLIQFIYGVNDR